MHPLGVLCLAPLPALAYTKKLDSNFSKMASNKGNEESDLSYCADIRDGSPAEI